MERLLYLRARMYLKYVNSNLPYFLFKYLIFFIMALEYQANPLAMLYFF